MIVLGIMNGTSGDGIDYVLTDIHFDKKLSIRFLKHVHFPLSKTLAQKMQKIITNKATTYELGEFHHELGRLYAQQYKEIKFSKKMSPQLIGLHGQTVYHRGGFATWQLGEPSYLAKTADRPVIFNFRAADIANGGQGAPLAPVLHKTLLNSITQKPVAFHNLGGISNLTYCYKKSWMAFDTGPANTLLDIWIQNATKQKTRFDDRGQIAAKGLPHQESLDQLLSHAFFKKKFPKSCGREEFNLDFIHAHVGRKFHRLSLEDQMATLTELTALSIFNSYKNSCPQMPESIYFSGGGVNNLFLMHRLKMYFGSRVVKVSDDLGWPSQAIEGAAFALLAYLRVYEQPLDLSPITGSQKATLLGQMCEM